MKTVQYIIPNVMIRSYNISVYPLSNHVINRVESQLCDGPTAILFSGGWRLNFDAVYLEYNNYQNINIPNLPKKTYFVDVSNTALIHKVLRDFGAKNVLFLHSASFCNYRSLDQLAKNMDDFAVSGAQVILTVPTTRTNFNRLKYSCEDIAQQYSAEYVDDSFIIKRNRQLSKQA
jgi:hypothetical protein